MFLLDILGEYYRCPLKILENPRKSGKLGPKVPIICDKYCNMSACTATVPVTKSSENHKGKNPTFYVFTPWMFLYFVGIEEGR